MGASSIGNLQTKSVLFNSGILTVNGDQLGNITNLVVTDKFTEASLYVLGSIIKNNIKRSKLEQSVSCDMEGSVYRDLYAVFFGASSAGSGDYTYTVLDGQQAAATVMITAYQDDDATKYYQFVLTNPTLLTHDITLAAQAYDKVKVDFACTQLSLKVATAVAN